MDLAANRAGRASTAAARSIARARPVPTLLARVCSRSTTESELRETAEAERRTGITLDRLGPAWRVLHSVPLGPNRSPISHLVIGPGGVFTVLPSLHRVWRRQLNPERVVVRVVGDEVLIDGVAKPYLVQARAQAWRAARALSAATGQAVRVRPIVVIVGPEDISFHGPTQRVEVLGRRHLARRLRDFGVRYSAEQVAALHESARRSDIWSVGTTDCRERKDGAGPGDPDPAPSANAWLSPGG